MYVFFFIRSLIGAQKKMEKGAVSIFQLLNRFSKKKPDI